MKIFGKFMVLINFVFKKNYHLFCNYPKPYDDMMNDVIYTLKF